MNDEDLFDDADDLLFEGDNLGFELEESVTPPQEKPDETKKPKRGRRAETMKDSEAKSIQELVPEFKNEGLTPGRDTVLAGSSNVIIVDVRNSDDRKTVYDLMREGRVIVDTKDRPFILAVQNKKIYNLNDAPVHKVYVDEIQNITIRSYWLDLESIPKGKRTLSHQIIWCLHKGYETHSMVTIEQVEYLLANKLISNKQISYTHSDLSTGGTFYMGNDSSEPTDSFIKKKEDERMKDYNTVNKISSGEEILDEELAKDDAENMDIVDGLEDLDLD